MNEIARILWHQTWWSWSRPQNEPYLWTDFACRGFNLFEAVAWFGFALLVIRRYLKHRRSGLEICYAIAFVLFGISDLIEASRLTSWLLWWKAINLVGLFWLRRQVLRHHYPESRLF